MKVSKVDHVKSGIDQNPCEYGGMLYKHPGTKYEGSKQLREHIEALNQRARALYQVFNIPQDKNRDEKIQSVNSFMKMILKELARGSSDDLIVSQIRKYHTGDIISENDIQNMTGQYLKESLRKTVRVDGKKGYIPDMIIRLLNEKFAHSSESLSNGELKALVSAIREDYLKKEQIQKIACSIEKKSTPVQIKKVDSEKRIVLASSGNSKKENVFGFLREYAEASPEEQKNMLRHMRYLILLYFYGAEKITEDYQQEITAWSFGSIVQDKELRFSEQADILMQEKECIKQEIEEKKKEKAEIRPERNAHGFNEEQKKKRREASESIKANTAKLRIMDDKLQNDINNHIVSRYQAVCLHVQEKDIPWVRYISDHTSQMFHNKKQIRPDKLSLGELCKETWNIWLSYIAKKYIDMGKGVYHFAMSQAPLVGKEKGVVLGKVNPEFEGGISSFDYERIKAEDDLHRNMTEYVTFAVNNFSRAICSNKEMEKGENQDLLNVDSDKIVFSDNAKERLLRYFGGASSWKDSTMEIIETEELVECIKKYLKTVRNVNFHFAGSIKETRISDEIMEELVNKEAGEVGKYYRKTFYANNVTRFYKNEDIYKLMDHLYQKKKEYRAQIPSFNKVISRSSLPNIIFDYVKGKNRTKISDPETMNVFRGTFYFLLKEIYYNNFLQEENLKEMFLKALEKVKDNGKKEEPYQNFIQRFHELEEMNLDFGEICQQIMTDYEQQNGYKKKIASAVAGKDGKPKVIEDTRQKYKHFRTLLYLGLKEAFTGYLKDERNKEWYSFLKEPVERGQTEEGDFANNWNVSQFEDRKEIILSNVYAGAWYVTAHFINPTQLNHLIGDIKNYIQFIQDIDRRAKNTGNRTNAKTKEQVEHYLEILSVLELAKYVCGQTTNQMEDYYRDEEDFAEHIGMYVNYRKSVKKNEKSSYLLQAFCSSEYKTGKNKRKLGIYYDGMNPIMNRNVILADLYGNEKILTQNMIPVEEKEIREYYKVMDNLEKVMKNGAVCETEDEQNALRHFQNLKNRIELVDVLTISELVNDFMSQLIGWAYLRERDMMYLQLGLYYIKLYFTDSVPKDSFLRKMEFENGCSIEDGAVLYQIAALYSFDYSLYTRKEEGHTVDKQIDKGSIGKKFRLFEKEYCRDDGEVIENGLCLFENINDHKKLSDFRNYIVHFKYKAKKQTLSIMDMYSKVYDSFFSYDIKLKKSVSYIITNTLLSYFVNAKLNFTFVEEDYKKIKRKATHICIASAQSDYFTYKLKQVVKDKNGREKVDTKESATVSVKARESVFIEEVIRILEYKNTEG